VNGDVPSSDVDGLRSNIADSSSLVDDLFYREKKIVVNVEFRFRFYLLR
jgi:hypothetical protein